MSHRRSEQKIATELKQKENEEEKEEEEEKFAKTIPLLRQIKQNRQANKRNKGTFNALIDFVDENFFLIRVCAIEFLQSDSPGPVNK